MTVTIDRDGAIAVLTIDNPPVNALGTAVRTALLDQITALSTDASVQAIVLIGAGRMFVGGADIKEFDAPPAPPHLPDLICTLESVQKPVVAALHGSTLGGGFELGLGCAYRVAAADLRLALPEINLGIIPGAGGTQRLPRLIGPAAAVPVIAENRALTASDALKLGLISHIIEGDLRAGAIAFARAQIGRPLPALAATRPIEATDALWTEAEARIKKSAKGLDAAPAALAVVRYGALHGFDQGLQNERATFMRLRASDQAAALRHLFFAERAAPRPVALRDVKPAPLTRVGVIGGGTMGAGIAVALRNAGLEVVLSERDEAALARGLATMKSAFATAAARGLITEAVADQRLAGVTGAIGLEAMADCDLVIEAVFEDLAVKRAVFADLGRICRPDAMLATNTSYIDPRLIAEGLPHPDRFIGLHFFSPAQVMKLLEIIPTPQTSRETLATGFDLARRLGKVPVQSGICDGFIGNRILRRYRGEAEVLLRQGVPAHSIDAAMRGFGFAMGPFEVQDLSGLDISWMQREAARQRGEDVPLQPGDLLVQAGRKGQKTGAGWYDYTAGDRKPHRSAEAERIIAPLVSGSLTLSDAQIADRLLAAMASEGQAILAEGIAGSASDIDLVEIHGYGFPRGKGGPMFHASRQG
ncbi:MAG: 3-hydroxyacyl-CoA dehydrogenase NAD-binding domain-containing protein [Cypionkella sp.]